MERRKAIQLGLAAAAAGLAPAGAQAAHTLRDQLMPHWKKSQDYTLELARAMPAEHYTFKPVPEVWTFGQQLSHIAEGIFLLVGAVRGERRQPIAPRQLDKEAAIQRLTAAYDYGASALESLADADADRVVQSAGGQRSKRDIFLLVLDHCTHHRGQAVVYLRLKGIVPPPYRE